jgi:hypothetical protein
MGARVTRCKPVPKRGSCTKPKIAPDVLRTWNAKKVREWAISDVRIDAEDADRLLSNKITGTFQTGSHRRCDTQPDKERPGALWNTSGTSLLA